MKLIIKFSCEEVPWLSVDSIFASSVTCDRNKSQFEFNILQLVLEEVRLGEGMSKIFCIFFITDWLSRQEV